MTPESAPIDRLADDVRARVHPRGITVAVAESLTGGALAAALARAQDAGEWFAGGVVAYTSATKFRVLGVPEGPVVTARAARAMAVGALELTGADVAVAVTGVGGPGAEEGRPAGTVFMCTAVRTADEPVTHDFAHEFEGEPEDIVASTIEHALRHLSGALLV
jgi:competence/damage-inducible protein CinA C-terminal domain